MRDETEMACHVPVVAQKPRGHTNGHHVGEDGQVREEADECCDSTAYPSAPHTGDMIRPRQSCLNTSKTTPLGMVVLGFQACSILT